VAKGDLIIIACYVLAEDEEADKWKPKCVFVDSKNKIKKLKK
jgi:aspartate 1-decarboxylase